MLLLFFSIVTFSQSTDSLKIDVKKILRSKLINEF
jgi:hypothetical protein